MWPGPKTTKKWIPKPPEIISVDVDDDADDNLPLSRGRDEVRKKGELSTSSTSTSGDSTTDRTDEDTTTDEGECDNKTDAKSDCDKTPNINRGRPLPHEKFLELDDLLALLQNTREGDAMMSIPLGPKENVYYVVNNSENVERRKKGLPSNFVDDRGAWASGPTNKTLYKKIERSCSKVVYKDHVYCFARRLDKKVRYLPLVPQPDSTEILTLHRYYVKHTTDNTYEKRVSWLSTEETPKVAVHEYRGVTPQPYGQTMAEKKSPMQACAEANLLTGPRKKNVLYNAKAGQSKKEAGSTNQQPASLADQVAALEDLQDALPFVRLILRQPGKAPSIILYTDDQISDIVRFCTPPSASQSTVLGVNKTFKLGGVHVTVTVYKHLAVNRRGTEQHPIFCGPIYLHGDTDKDTYFMFFQHIAGLLTHTQRKPIVGSEEESDVRQAVATAFPGAPRVSCTRHLMKNLDQFLRDQICLERCERKAFIALIFGDNGILKADTVTLREAVQKHQDKMLKGVSVTQREMMVTYMKKTFEMLEENVSALQRPGPCSKNAAWTNHNCPAMNDVLQQACAWKSLNLVPLVEMMHEVVEAQYRELERAILGFGEFTLADEFSTFATSRHKWHQMPPQSRKELWWKFMTTYKEVVQSTDKLKIVSAPKHKGENSEKLKQTKRKKKAKTTSRPKKSRLS